MDNAADGARDIAAAVETLAGHLPPALAPLAAIAYNYRWSWDPLGRTLFPSIDPQRWERGGRNPVRLLQEVAPAHFDALAADPAFVRRVEELQQRITSDSTRPAIAAEGGPIAFFSAEFGFHCSLPFYAGGLGVLAGDLLKEASDQALSVVGMSLFYWEGSFHQRLDAGGWQHEYWSATDSDRLPAAIVTGDDGRELQINVPFDGRNVLARVWRADVGRVPLYLLDANLPANRPADRWITARLYVGDPRIRLAQYVLLGIGGVRALAAMGIRPAVFHLNEGHAALATLELLREHTRSACSVSDAIQRVRKRTLFTTHTPVAAGHPTCSEADLHRAVGRLADEAGIPWTDVLALGKAHPSDPGEPFGLTTLALRLAGTANGVSRRHGETSREMWRHLWPGTSVADVPIGHITNGVHRATWMSPRFEALFRRHVPGWDPEARGAWDAIEDVPDSAVWEARCELRAELAAYVRERTVFERLGRGEPSTYAELAATAWSDDVLTIGFARRIATYKRLGIITGNVERGLRIVNGPHPVQLIIAGRAHPQDEDAKQTVQAIFALNDIPGLAGRVVFLDEYDLAMAARLVRGCDLWLNVPRPPLEASGTSGMKAILNGGLHLSVLDGWWAEAYDGTNGWAIGAQPELDPGEQDVRDSATLYDILEQEVLPLFYERGDDGVPHGWVRRVKNSVRTLAPQFVSSRMVGEYAAVWRRTSTSA